LACDQTNNTNFNGYWPWYGLGVGAKNITLKSWNRFPADMETTIVFLSVNNEEIQNLSFQDPKFAGEFLDLI